MTEKNESRLDWESNGSSTRQKARTRTVSAAVDVGVKVWDVWGEAVGEMSASQPLSDEDIRCGEIGDNWLEVQSELVGKVAVPVQVVILNHRRTAVSNQGIAHVKLTSTNVKESSNVMFTISIMQGVHNTVEATGAQLVGEVVDMGKVAGVGRVKLITVNHLTEWPARMSLDGWPNFLPVGCKPERWETSDTGDIDMERTCAKPPVLLEGLGIVIRGNGWDGDGGRVKRTGLGVLRREDIDDIEGRWLGEQRRGHGWQVENKKVVDGEIMFGY
ncbi:hypothetical protein CONPUDRAFT_73042 [Coniophora puteana RWD-64-598 SS2]|uniref:Uncharacterized protein n=1 Tax=Coniophora puteana (strain RWD-64-598) TaxID=741705 RepID=A0A5M3MQB9_CONPW|nr:uncharacterized protein CONPUDRAFT_73042 [Coniophora puteana RWD-64-598 SS2]EIW81260.1 hypothetical protein CONPUDRAFT_73042 [Coniophora puteana RWD-64-598 SS2]